MTAAGPEDEKRPKKTPNTSKDFGICQAACVSAALCAFPTCRRAFASVPALARGLAVKVWSHSSRCACTSVCDSWPALKRSSSVRRGIRNVCDVASAGEKANRKKERCGGDKGKRVCFDMTAAGIRRGRRGEARSHPRNCL